MRQHLRSYKFTETQCQKLPGFKYSGDLSRHKREAHDKHGVPKETLKCTVVVCKRKPGKGFKRKENLDEHLRRVHGITATSGSQLHAIARVATELAEAPSSHLTGIGDADKSSTVITGYPGPAICQRSKTSVYSRRIDLKSELKKLRASKLERDKRVSQLEEKRVSMEARLEYLEHELVRLTKYNP
jgi:hypothetical protein